MNLHTHQHRYPYTHTHTVALVKKQTPLVRCGAGAGWLGLDAVSHIVGTGAKAVTASLRC